MSGVRKLTQFLIEIGVMLTLISSSQSENQCCVPLTCGSGISLTHQQQVKGDRGNTGPRGLHGFKGEHGVRGLKGQKGEAGTSCNCAKTETDIPRI